MYLKCLRHFYSTITSSSSSSKSHWLHLIRTAISQNNLRFGKAVHALIVTHGPTTSDRFLTNNLINMYSKCGELHFARRLFDITPKRDIVTWNSILTAYASCCESNSSNVQGGLKLFKKLVTLSNVLLSSLTFAPVLKLCLMSGYVCASKCVHGYVIKFGLDLDMLVSGALVNIYIKFGRLSDARTMFADMAEHDRDVVLWDMMMRAYIKSGLREEALRFLLDFHKSEIGHPDIDILRYVFSWFNEDFVTNGTYNEQLKAQLQAYAIKLCFMNDEFDHMIVLWNKNVSWYYKSVATAVENGDLRFGEQIHGMILKTGFHIDVNVSNCLINMYLKMDDFKSATKVLFEMEESDSLSWNFLITAYAQSGLKEEFVELYKKMLDKSIKPDEITLATMVKACGFVKNRTLGTQVHGYVLKCGFNQDLYLGCTLVEMYIKCEELEDSHKVFEEIEYPDNVVWTCLISGCVENGDEDHAFLMYDKMRRSGVSPDEYTFAKLIKACSNLTALEQGRQIHADVIKFSRTSDTFVCTSLINFYAKCGVIEESYQLYNRARVQSIALSNAMLMGLAQYGDGQKALELFDNLKSDRNILPDRVTFIGVLTACANSGLVSEAYKYFNSMSTDYGIEPDIEHYSCLVDGLSRAGHVQEAEKLIASMRFEVCGSMYRTLLGSCWFRGDMETGKRVATKLLKLEPFDSSTYVLLSNSYAACKQWSDVADVRKVMKSKNVEKVPGFSRIDVKYVANVFVADDRMHPQREMIYDKLKDLMNMIREDRYIEDAEHV